jgi:murein DD-endopeptidase MepM/ murein hydrolase activator NlpD
VRLFEHKRAKTILGSNLAFVVLAGAIIPQVQAQKINGETIAQVQEVSITDTASVVTERAIQSPVNPIRITQGYTIFHPGVDLDGVTGDPIYPIMPGKVINIQSSKFAYGNAVILDHGAGITSLYAHLSKIFVKIGEEVKSTTKIGEMGATGHATGDHLHLEVRKDGHQINPFTIVPLTVKK